LSTEFDGNGVEVMSVGVRPGVEPGTGPPGVVGTATVGAGADG